uniref:Uncharacterized protein n=1 Tax=Esox lucius TaxID=8010 RepID=A0A3P8ZC20_ESOLU
MSSSMSHPNIRHTGSPTLTYVITEVPPYKPDVPPTSPVGSHWLCGTTAYNNLPANFSGICFWLYPYPLKPGGGHLLVVTPSAAWGNNFSRSAHPLSVSVPSYYVAMFGGTRECFLATVHTFLK